MAADLKTGLLFGAIGLIAVTIASFIPWLGIIVGAPLVAACVGMRAGYVGAQRQTHGRAFQAGIIAGSLAGIGTLLGPGLFMLLVILLLRADPVVFHPIVQAFYAQSHESMTPRELQDLVSQYAPVSALCYGAFNLVIAVACSLLGSRSAIRASMQQISATTARQD